MKIIQEQGQEIDFDAIEQDIRSSTPTTTKKPVNTNVNKGGGTGSNKGDTNTTDNTDTKKDSKIDATEEERKIAGRSEYIGEYILNAISFFENIGPLTVLYDIPEDRVAKIISRRLAGSRSQCTWADWIIRLANSNSPTSNSARKYPKQYGYVLTQNGKTSATLDYLRNIPKHPSLITLNDLVNPAKDLGDYLGVDDVSDTYGKTIRNSLRLDGKFTFKTEDNTVISSKFNYPAWPPTMEKIVLALYTTSAYGSPKKQYKIY
jgi:hypothetical protein